MHVLVSSQQLSPCLTQWCVSQRSTLLFGLLTPVRPVQSLSKLEKDVSVAEERRVQLLRERDKARAGDEKKKARQELEERKEHTRFCVKGALPRGSSAPLAASYLPEAARRSRTAGNPSGGSL